jgi:hydroxymethylglutaryl-CoA reductase (NADPH)
VAESSVSLVHTELPADGSYYYSITIQALIVATHGRGTGLPTQRECLELLGCYGPGRVRKFQAIAARLFMLPLDRHRPGRPLAGVRGRRARAA